MTTEVSTPSHHVGEETGGPRTDSPEPKAYDVVGPRGAPAIVFIHGTRLTRKAWTAQVTALSDEFRTICMDLPGHGVLADVPFTLTGASDRLAEVIDAEAGGRAIVVGLSLGGFVGSARWSSRVRPPSRPVFDDSPSWPSPGASRRSTGGG